MGDYYCYKCSTSLQLSAGKAGRTESCDKCRADLHCCLNCVHHDLAAYNQCRESQAERVVDKDRGNFCDYFRFIEGKRKSAAGEKDSTLKKLDDLFK